MSIWVVSEARTGALVHNMVSQTGKHTFVILIFWGGEAVGDFKTPIDIQAKQLSGDGIWHSLVAVLDDLHDHLNEKEAF